MTTQATRKKRTKIILWTGVFLLLVILAVIHSRDSAATSYSRVASTTVPARSTTAVAITPLPDQTLLNDDYYAPQSFNNCGPAALSMDLSFYGVHVTQEVLADALRPDHNTTGKDDDKATSPDEIAAQAEQYGLIAYYRPAGTISLLKQLLAAGFPVMVRTLFMTDDQVAHYRVITGYNDETGQITDEDGFQGPDVMYSYNDFTALWKYYNYDYIVLTTPANQAKLEAILGPDVNDTTAWQQALTMAQQAVAANPNDAIATFDISTADYYLGDYAGSVKAYESVATQIPPDALWYQMEPLESYYELGDYAPIFTISNAIFTTNPAYPELYVLRGQAYEKEGDDTDAKAQFERALTYNPNLQSAKDALAALGN